MKVVAFGASTSNSSINQELASFTAHLFSDDVEILQLKDYEMPLFSVDKEAELGIPQQAKQFLEKIQSADLLIISLAEHNGAYTAAFKNTFDWVTRLNMKCFSGKKLFLLATSPGARGGKTVLEIASGRFPFHAGEIIGKFSLPSFGENFVTGKGITNLELAHEFSAEVQKVKNAL